MDRLTVAAEGKLSVSKPPISDALSCYDSLAHDAHTDILYFFTHGHSHRLEGETGRDRDLELFIQQYEQLDLKSPLRETYKFLYESIKCGEYERDRSWIRLSNGKVYLDLLYDDIIQLPSRPLVILNMSESAQVMSSLADESFVSFFLNRGARTVLGTECPMTIQFAHPFSEILLTHILIGEDVGLALLRARQHFITYRNPLGLAYALFGSATLRFDPSPIRQSISDS